MIRSSDQILEASAAWVSPWFPPKSVHVDMGWLEFYVVDGAATVMRVLPEDMAGAELVDRVLAELRNQGVTEAFWTVGPMYSPENVDQVLLDLGARVHGTIDIRACPLPRALPDDQLPDAATAPPVCMREDVAEFERVNALAWGYPQPSVADVDKTFASLTEGSFIGYWNDTPAGAGGYTLAGEVARLWGAAVVPAFRRRGVYRTLVRARLAEAMSRGATLALVHANDQTSSLQRLGFQVHGHQRVLAFRLGAARFLPHRHVERLRRDPGDNS